jgi:AcrR family transcriptional regulator
MSTPIARPTRAERREQTISDLVDAAERRFIDGGFHATTVDQVAADAGYTKGAVYSNFASKEELFFAVYERRATQAVTSVQALIDEHGPEHGLRRLAGDTSSRRGRDDGWLAVFFEFWAHVLRHPELRERFAAVRRRSRAPLERALEQVAAERGAPVPFDVTEATIAMNAAQLGIALERLTDPERVGADLGERVARIAFERMADPR